MQGEMWHGRLLLAAVLAVLSTFAVAVAAEADEDAVPALLPDLVQERPSGLQVTTVRTPKGPRFRLGFRSAVNNAGTGPLIIEGSRPGIAQREMTGRQLVRTASGQTAAREGVARLRYHHAGDHRHWHVLRFEVYELRRAGGGRVRPAQKTGFCLGDRYTTDQFRGRPFDAPVAEFLHFCGLDRPDLLKIRVGITVGFGDDYDPQLEGQYVDVTGLPAGDYDLVHRVNADGALLESDSTNNEACLGVKLSWPRGTRQPPRFRATTCHTHTTHTEAS